MESNELKGGIGFEGALAILFIGLKLTGYISWPWLWVLAPVWIPFAFVCAVLMVMGVLALIFKLAA